MDGLYNLICLIIFIIICFFIVYDWTKAINNVTDFCKHPWLLTLWIKETWENMCNKCFKHLCGGYVLAHNIYNVFYLKESIVNEDIYLKYPIHCFDENNNWTALSINGKFVYYKNRKSRYEIFKIFDLANNGFHLVCAAPKDAKPLEFTEGLKQYHCYSIENVLIDEGIPTLWLRICSIVDRISSFFKTKNKN